MTKAIRFHRHGGPEVLQLEDIALNPPGPDEARIKTAAIGVNFLDTNHRIGFYPLPMPSGIGVEASGTIEALGAHVDGFAVGERVSFSMAPLGAYAEAVNVPAKLLVKLPDAISHDVAAAVTLKGLTVEYLLRRTYQVKAGDTIVLYAAAGGVGLIASQWAKAMGATVIGIVSNDAKAELARQNGCAHTLILGRDDIAKSVRALTGGKGVPAVYDSTGKDTFETSLDCLRIRGHLVSFGAATGQIGVPDLGILMRKGSLTVTRPNLADYIADRAELDAAAAALFDAIMSGKIKVSINQRYALADAARAHEELRGRKTTGASILIP